MGMKGQYFIVASIIFSSIFFSTMLLVVTPEFIPESEHRELVYFMENLLQEYPYAFDDGINNSKELGYLKNFTLFARQIGAEHNIELHALWFFTKYNNSLNITIGNFL
ncbi:MAG TPA: hypothetical protein ENG42_01620, partial [Candidatus Aenigmarchaeota archaeon]|nr:hypothetical protein [Candidatus Aenigmarchaeota archaeon]